MYLNSTRRRAARLYRTLDLCGFLIGLLALVVGLVYMEDAYEVGGYLQRGACHFLTIVGALLTYRYGSALTEE